jgi:hypothetical protein
LPWLSVVWVPAPAPARPGSRATSVRELPYM